MKQLFVLLACITLFNACKVEPQKIDYGTDVCHYCFMTIVDRQHAAEIVTKKGKAYKFDAIECMVHHLQQIDTSTIQLYLCNSYSTPEKLINAQTSTYLISEAIPSPMGAYLSGFESLEEAQKVQAQKKGELFDWRKLLLRFEALKR